MHVLKAEYLSLSYKIVCNRDQVNFIHFCQGKLRSWHGCISDASLRLLMQCLRDISKRGDFQISETSHGSLIKSVSSETYLRSLRFSQRPVYNGPSVTIRPSVCAVCSCCTFSIDFSQIKIILTSKQSLN